MGCADIMEVAAVLHTIADDTDVIHALCSIAACARGVRGAGRPVTIVGFPEHIFTQSSGFVTAILMAVQERYFGTFFQRVLAAPLDVRLHYGHPDIVDKLHFLTRGGCSSAAKELYLSGDVFAGFTTTLRGGRVVFKEYHQLGKGRMTNLGEIHGFFAKLSQGAAGQLMSRDVYRITRLLPTERLVAVADCSSEAIY